MRAVDPTRGACAVHRSTGCRSARAGAGLSFSLGVARGDGPTEADAPARARSRAYGSSRTTTGEFDRSLLETGGEALVVSQFTLIADAGRRATARASPEQPRAEQAEPLYERFCESLRGARRPGRDRALRSADAGRARQRRPGHDRPRGRARGGHCGFLSRPSETRDSGASHALGGAILYAPHFTV